MVRFIAATDGATAAQSGPGAPHRAEEAAGPYDYILRLAPGADPAAIEALRQALGAQEVERTQSWGFVRWRLEAELSPEALAQLSAQDWYPAASESLDYITPDLSLAAAGFSDDPETAQQWHLQNDGQNGGRADADIDAPEAWASSRGAGVTVAVLDTGVDLTHPDLAANLWVNPGEIPGNGRDDDGNGYVDDVHGYDFYDNDGRPEDAHGHGTHVAGLIAALAENGIGGAGVAPEAQIMALRFLGPNGSGSVFDAIQALEYAVRMGADLSNNSWGGAGNSAALRDAILLAGAAGQLFVASAGNGGQNTDLWPHYPSGFEAPNILAVGATTRTDALASFSNYGIDSVDVTAPGQSVYSLDKDGGYRSLSGTSMAAPQAAGVAALMLAQNPQLSPDEIITRLIESSDPVGGLAARSASGGRINARAALEAETSQLAGQLRDQYGGELAGWDLWLDLDGNGRRDGADPTAISDAGGHFRFADLPTGPATLHVELPFGYHDGAAPPLPGAYRLSPGPGPAPDAAPIYLDLGDDGVVLWDLPFALPFFDQSFEQIYISANGLISFTAPTGPLYHPDLAQAPAYSLAPFWTDLNSAHGGRISLRLDAEAQILALRYEGLRSHAGQGPYDIELRLSGSGDITWIYHHLGPLPEDLKIGLRGADAAQIWSLTAPPESGTALRLTQSPAPEMTRDLDLGLGRTELAPLIAHQEAEITSAPLSLEGRVWIDANRNGRREEGEDAAAGQILWLDLDQDGLSDPGEPLTFTDAQGAYRFSGLAPGLYHIGMAPQAPLAQPAVISGYQLSEPSLAWADLPAGRQEITGLQEDATLEIALPFAFPFFGADWTRATLSEDGWIGFGAQPGGPRIASFATDLRQSAASQLTLYHDPIQQRLTFEASGLSAYQGGGWISSQTHLYADGRIEMIYRDHWAFSAPVEIGLSDGIGQTLAAPRPESDSFAFRFTPETSPEEIAVWLLPEQSQTERDLALHTAGIEALSEGLRASAHFDLIESLALSGLGEL